MHRVRSARWTSRSWSRAKTRTGSRASASRALSLRWLVTASGGPVTRRRRWRSITRCGLACGPQHVLRISAASLLSGTSSPRRCSRRTRWSGSFSRPSRHRTRAPTSPRHQAHGRGAGQSRESSDRADPCPPPRSRHERVGHHRREGPWSGAGAGCVGMRSSKGAGDAAVGGVRETRLREGATCRAGVGEAQAAAGASEHGDHLGDGGRGGDDRAYEEPSAATDADAKVDVEGALQEGTPNEPRARGVELTVEQAIPVGERHDVRRDELGDAGRRQGSCRDECVEHEGRAPIARFERTRSRRRGRGVRRRLRVAVLRSPPPCPCGEEPAPEAVARHGHASDGATPPLKRRRDTSEGARGRQDGRVPRWASSHAALLGRGWPSSRSTRRCCRGVRGGARARRPAG